MQDPTLIPVEDAGAPLKVILAIVLALGTGIGSSAMAVWRSRAKKTSRSDPPPAHRPPAPIAPPDLAPLRAELAEAIQEAVKNATGVLASRVTALESELGRQRDSDARAASEDRSRWEETQRLLGEALGELRSLRGDSRR